MTVFSIHKETKPPSIFFKEFFLSRTLHTLKTVSSGTWPLVSGYVKVNGTLKVILPMFRTVI